MEQVPRGGGTIELAVVLRFVDIAVDASSISVTRIASIARHTDPQEISMEWAPAAAGPGWA
jgi:hypothetical protein